MSKKTERSLRDLELEGPLTARERGMAKGATGSYVVLLYGVGGEKIESYDVASYEEGKRLELRLSQDHEGDGMYALLKKKR